MSDRVHLTDASGRCVLCVDGGCPNCTRGVLMPQSFLAVEDVPVWTDGWTAGYAAGKKRALADLPTAPPETGGR